MNEEALEEYIRKHYPRMFKNKPVIIEEQEKFITVKYNKDASPVILSKDVLKII
tara:strand:+ start:1315 stop:1476 length:162 start_codon:yes stop_codon:yes gene_type:complete